MIWAGLAGFAAVAVAAVWAWSRWLDVRWQHHEESALALADARRRHPVTRDRCMCGRFAVDADTQWVARDRHGELFHHGHRLCQPARDVL